MEIIDLIMPNILTINRKIVPGTDTINVPGPPRMKNTNIKISDNHLEISTKLNGIHD